MVPRRRRVRRQVQHVRQVVAFRELRRLEIQDRGDEDDAVEGNALLDEGAGQAGRACRPVAFADQKQRRGPPVAACQVEADELADGLDVAVEIPELRSQLRLRGPAVAGADRVDEDEIGAIEPRLLVVDQRERRRRHPAVIEHADATGAERAEVKPDRRGAGAAVEGEHQRALRGIGDAVQGVRDVEDRRLRLSLVRLDGHAPDGGRVAKRPRADVNFVVSDDRRLFGRGRRLRGRCRSAAGAPATAFSAGGACARRTDPVRRTPTTTAATLRLTHTPFGGFILARHPVSE